MGQNRKLRNRCTNSWTLVTWDKTEKSHKQQSSEINNTSHMILFKMQNHVIMYDIKSQSKENFLEVGMC